ncbi:MAG: T9SS type B sorting domain-containing protein [Chitinophagales bacterium]|nr:T9SS type B sorting domain-containing protein [Chitinophagales bacterium]
MAYFLKKISIALTIVLCLLLTSNSEVSASHAMGADLFYEYIGTTPNGNPQYLVTLYFYRDCDGVSAPTSPVVDFAGCGVTQTLTLTQTSVMEVSNLCPNQIGNSTCNGGTMPGVEQYCYSATVTLSQNCDDWVVSYDLCCRNALTTNLLNPDQHSIYIEATISNPDTNTSPIWNDIPVPYVCASQLAVFNYGGVDPDGDSLVYILIDPLDGPPPVPITHVAPFTATYPLQTTTGTFPFDSTSGQISFVPSIQQVNVVTILVEEYRNGVLVGSTIRDFQIVVLPPNLCSPNPDIQSVTSLGGGTQLDSARFQVCPGTLFDVDILITDPQGNNLSITSSVLTALPGATFTPIGSGDTIIANIQWTPALKDTGTHQFIIDAINDACPIFGNDIKVYEVVVLKEVRVTPDSAVYCGTPVPLSALGGSIFAWNPITNLSDPNSFTPFASPTVPTTYTFTSDCGVDSVFIDVNPPFFLDAGPNDTICANGLTQLQATTDNLYAPYTFEWFPKTGLFDPVTGLPNSFIPNPIASPPVTTKYFCYITGSNGCTRIDSMKVIVNGEAPVVVATVSQDSICPEDIVQLNVYTNPTNCGLTTKPCNGSNSVGQLGFGSHNIGSITQYPAIFGNWSNSAKQQFLYPANEIIAAVGAGGTVREIAFELTNLQSTTPLENFVVRIGCTNKTELTNWEKNLVLVHTPKTIVPALGWNTIPFDFEYDWDGFSNLIVEVCFYNPSSALSPNNRQTNTQVSYNSTLTAASAFDLCNIANPPTPSNSNKKIRPNIRFTICTADLTLTEITWTPGIGINRVSDSTMISPTANPQYSQTYSVDVSDSGCIGSNFISVFVDTTLSLKVSNDTFICQPNAGVQLRAIVSNSNANIQWVADPPDATLNPGIANPLVMPTVSTMYKVTVSAVGTKCVFEDSVFVDVGNNLPLNFGINHITCNGLSDANIKVLPLAGIPPFNYSWNVPGSTDSISNLAGGVYVATVVDSVGCTGIDSVLILEPPAYNLNMSGTDLSCFQDSSGECNAGLTGGTPPYTYSWPASTLNSPTISNLPAGTYTVNITDANNCPISGSVTITEPPALTLNLTGTNATINGVSDGSVNTTVNGGTLPFTYNWTPNVTGGPFANNLPAGQYIVEVIDNNGCNVFDTITLTEPPPFLLYYSTTDNPCNGDSLGSIVIDSVTGGTTPYTTIWVDDQSNTTNTLANIPAGTYQLLLIDAANDTIDQMITISEPTAISIQLTGNDPSCHNSADGSIASIVSGGTMPYGFLWQPGSGGNQNLTNVPAGTYTLLVTDGNQCQETASATIDDPDSLVVQIIQTDSVSCNGGTDGYANTTIMGGTSPYNYNWSMSASFTSSASNLPAGTNQFVIASDNKGCIDSAFFDIFEPTAIIINLFKEDASCETSNDGRAWANVSGGFSPYVYNWTPTNQNSDTATSLDVGTYTFLVTDDRNCIQSSTITIDTTYALRVSMISDSATCFGFSDGSATVVQNNGSTPYSYSWNTTPTQFSITANNLSAGNYSVTVTDAVGCIAINNVDVGQPENIVLNLDFIPPTCFGDSNGIAWVTVDPREKNDSYYFSWSNGSTNDTAFNIPSGFYSVAVSDDLGCQRVGNINVIPPTTLSAALIDVKDLDCFGDNSGAIEADASGGSKPYLFSWSNGDFGNKITNIPAGNYIMEVEDFQGCIDTLNVTVRQPDRIGFTSVFIDSTSCYEYSDGSILATGFGGSVDPGSNYTYSIDGIDYQASPVFAGLVAGVYPLYVKDDNGCIKDTSVTIRQPAPLLLNVFADNDTINLAQAVQLYSEIDVYDETDVISYSWSPTAGLNCSDCTSPLAAVYQTTVYELMVTYLNNCITTQEIEVVVLGPPPYFIPNAFTPNNDGQNDILKIFGPTIKNAFIQIYNRWGEKVFETSDQHISWDGSYRGELMNPGVYTIVAKLEFLDGSTEAYKGSVNLIR